jgi:hypothetical protein
MQKGFARMTGTAVLAVLGLGVAGWVALPRIEKAFEPFYAGSDACRECHAEHVTTWSETSHAKMMRRVDQPGAVLARLDSDAPEMPFHPDEAVWVIGSKWEQQFMGEDGSGETLLPGAWSVEHRRWKVQGWDGWQIPVPLQRCHGCHTVGLDPKTGKFVEAGIGCESCHGPSGQHARWGGGATVSTVTSEVCARCHVRGRSTAGPYFYPINLTPGDPIAGHFEPDEADYLQNSSAWWANGLEKNRHQQYSAWKRGGHADSLRTLKEDYDGRFGPVGPECLDCHAGEAAIRGPRHKLSLHQVSDGVTCVVCHNVHDAIELPRTGCESCHDKGAFHHADQPTAQHVPCPPSANVGCVSCHMPLTAKIGESYTVNSHAPGITPPIDADTVGSPTSCANGGCHADRSATEFQQAFERFYPNFRRAGSEPARNVPQLTTDASSDRHSSAASGGAP